MSPGSPRLRVGLHDAEDVALRVLGVGQPADAGDRHLRQDDDAAGRRDLADVLIHGANLDGLTILYTIKTGGAVEMGTIPGAKRPAGGVICPRRAAEADWGKAVTCRQPQAPRTWPRGSTGRPLRLPRGWGAKGWP